MGKLKIIGRLLKLNKKRERNNQYKHWHKDVLPKRNDILPLTEEEKKKVDEIWKPFAYEGRETYVWHEAFKAIRGSFEPEIVPCENFYLTILEKLNYREFSIPWNDKSYLARIFEGLPAPETAAVCIHGRLYDKNYNYITPEEACSHMKAISPRIFLKPSIHSGQGKGVEMIETASLTPEKIMELINDKARKESCIFQMPIRQSKQLAALNSSSVNILRINSLRVDGTIHPLNTTIRFGIPGMITDVGKDAEGNEVLNLLGVTDKGLIMEDVFSIDGNRTPVQKYGVQPGVYLEGYREAIEVCKKAHERLHHFDFVGFDIAIDENNQPLILEANTRTPGIFSYQYPHGPLFREYLPDVLRRCREF